MLDKTRKRSGCFRYCTLVGNLYKLDVPSHESRAFVATSSLQVWHERFGHIDPNTILNMVKNNSIDGVSIQNMKEDIKCDACVFGKGHRSAIPKSSTTKTSRILELVHSDVSGPMETPSLGGSDTSLPSLMIFLSGQ